jgi:hypothetical protein
MLSSSPVADYLHSLECALGFDAALARRIRREAEDHLWESAGAVAEGGIDPLEAQRRAIADFGEPREIARACAAASLFRQTRRLGLNAVLAVAGIFAAMKLRLAALGGLPPATQSALDTVRAVVFPIDFWAFTLALAIAALLVVYLACRRVPAAFHRGYRIELRCYVLICLIGTGALATSVLSSVVLMALRILALQSPLLVVPLLSVAAEIGVFAALVLHLRGAMRRMASVASLMNASG